MGVNLDKSFSLLKSASFVYDETNLQLAINRLCYKEASIKINK